MKNKLIFSFLFVFVLGALSQELNAQNMYVSLDGAYGLKTSPQDNSWYYTNIDYQGSIYTSEKVDFSLGQGIQTGATFGYMFTENIGVELGLSYFGGAPCKAHYIHVDTSGTYVNMNYSFSAKMARLYPSLIISTNTGKLRPYMKFGALFSRGSLEEIHEGVNNSGDYVTVSYRYNKGLASGFSAAFGSTYHLNDFLSVFTEMKMINMSYSPEKRLTTEYTENGVDLLPSMSTSEKEVEFVDSYDFDFNNQPATTEPSIWLKENYSLNSISLNIGVRFNL